jgi:hypothetical protein
MENRSEDSWSAGRDRSSVPPEYRSSVPPEYEEIVLTTEPLCSGVNKWTSAEKRN